MFLVLFRLVQVEEVHETPLGWTLRLVALCGAPVSVRRIRTVTVALTVSSWATPTVCGSRVTNQLSPLNPIPVWSISHRLSRLMIRVLDISHRRMW